MNPRPYQEEMISCAVAAFRTKKTVLIQAATGAGKTIVFAELIRRFLNDFPTMKILVLVHREIIVKQNADKLRRLWPTAPIGIACASASSRVDMHSPVVFGSIQTLASRIETLPMFHLVIIDEAHRLPPKSTESQYKKVLDRLEMYYPGLRIFGLTATPFRLSWGSIYGREHKRTSDEEPSKNWFDALDLEIGIQKLQAVQPDDENPDAPYLCGMRAFVEDKSISTELNSISKTAGEFNQGELSDLMQKTIHLQTALDAYRKHSEGRTRTVIFAVDIDHAEKIQKIFFSAGIMANCVHSEKDKGHNREVLEKFDAGSIPVVVNVGVLTEGWDCRSVDMLMLCRPTMSAALFVQIVGRGLRTYPGKQDVLILDLAGNFFRHGPPWAPILPDYSKPGRPKEKLVKPDKKCPACGHENQAGCWCCENCGEILKIKQIEEAKSVKLRELNLSRIAQAEQSIDTLTGVIESMEFSKYTTRQGNLCLKVSVFVGVNNRSVHVNHFFRLDGPGAWYFGKFWKIAMSQYPMPKTIDEAVAFDFNPLSDMQVKIKKDGKYWKVQGW